ncbi:DedA family protein [Microbacterium sp. CIAB417]|uniref:DedA family protein n=1 Tax=Microbacterium sp. CIAB417 TaxID=2860287 RepID=UPI001FAD4C79|nr:VTT domain-containing protein [Microbacterium sp. CIAB417]
MITEDVAALVTGPWALAIMALLVLGDAFFVVVPGEIAVMALGALAISTGAPSLWAVIACAAVAAACGDLLCYAIGRWAGTGRWRWMRARRIQQAQRWARNRLESGTAVVLFTGRFIPFARLAINLVAGATRIPLPRYGALVALAATGWAAYQAAIGAVIAAILPGGPLVAIAVSVATAVALGALIDLLLRRKARRAPSPSKPASD